MLPTSESFHWEKVMPQEPEDDRFAATRERVKQWLADDAYVVQDLPMPASSKGWLLMAHAERGEYLIGQTGERPAVLCVRAYVDLPALIGPDLERVDDVLIWSLRLGMLSLGVDLFSGLSRPLRRISLGADVCLEGMDRNDLAQALRRVHHAILFLVWSTHKALGHKADIEAVQPQPF